MAGEFDPNESWDNMHGPSPPDVHWSTDNVGEAVPGVMSPLSASIWSTIGETSTRESFVRFGAFSPKERGLPPLEERVVRIFCGRVALQVELMTLLGDRLPGTSGQDVAKALFGTIPDDIEYRPTKSRYPALAWKLPRTFITMPKRLREDPPRWDAWWRRSIAALPGTDLAGARRLLDEAYVEFEEALTLQSTSVSGHAQIVYEQLTGVIEAAGTGDIGVLSNTGGAEMAVIGDIWRASRGEMTLDDVVGNHGFHGPHEGEVSSVVWREDPAPLEKLIAEYAERPDSGDPRLREEEIRARLPEEQAKVLAALPRSKRPGAKMTLNMAAKRVPLRGLAKRSFLQGLDVIRACTRHIGAELADQGVLADPEDGFYLTMEELRGDMPDDVRDLVARRRERREAYRRVAIPGAWKGQVEPVPISEPDADDERPSLVEGVGVSPGVVEGVARVVTDPAFGEVEPDEILVAPTTDPGWSSIMFISAGLVVDIGGPISHAAVVARELGLPCVVNTRTGTRDIRTGDRVRVDGEKGTVEILDRG